VLWYNVGCESTLFSFFICCFTLLTVSASWILSAHCTMPFKVGNYYENVYLIFVKKIIIKFGFGGVYLLIGNFVIRFLKLWNMFGCFFFFFFLIRYVWMFGMGYTVFMYFDVWNGLSGSNIHLQKNKKVGVQDLTRTDLRKTVFIKLIIFCLMICERLLY